MAAKLFVGSLSWDTTNDSLKNFFSAAGTVVSATVLTDKFTGKSRGFGFVEMSTDEEAQKAIAMFNGQQLDGRAIVVNEARPMEPRENRGGGRPGGGYRGGGGGGHRGGRDFSRDDRGGRDW